MRGWYLGFLLSAMPIAAFFSAPILGALSDQKGRKPLFCFCLAIAVVGYICSMIGTFLESTAILILSRLVVGLANGSIGVVSAAVADLSKNDDASKAKNFGLFSMACGVGFAIGPFLGGQLSVYGFSVPFIAAAGATFVNLCLIFFFFKETHLVRQAAVIRFDEGIRNLIKAFRIPELRVLFATVLFFAGGWSFFYEFLPVVWIADYGVSSSEIGIFYAFGSAVYAICSGVLIRPVADRFPAHRILFYSLLALSGVILVLLAGPSIGWVWIYLTAVNFLCALAYPTYTTMISDLAGNAQGEILGVSGSVQSFAFAISPLAAGAVIGANVHLPLLIGGLSILAAALIFGLSFKKSASIF